MDKHEKLRPFSKRPAVSGTGDALPPRPSVDAEMSGLASDGLRVLVVEDQQDVRRMLVTALEIEGYSVDEASSAVEGLERLERADYDLVLSDYAMPGGTGTWMLQEATKRGLMASAVALIITAQPDVRELRDIAVIPKPLDLDDFLGQIRRILSSGRHGMGHDGRQPPSQGNPVERARLPR